MHEARGKHLRSRKKDDDGEDPITRQKGLRTDRFDGARDVLSALTRKLKYSNHKDKGDSVTLLSLLLARRGLGVTDPMDIVSAHLGFATDGQKFVAEYTKTGAQVYGDLLVLNGVPHELQAVIIRRKLLAH
jgi:hypothetical protein